MINIGDRFGKLVVVQDLGVFIKKGTKNKLHYYKCKCDCGNEVIIRDHSLLSNHTKSCGCYAKELKRNGQKPHKYNEYYIFNNIVFVKFSNCNEYFICDLDDWERLKQYTWLKDSKGYAVSSFSTTKRDRMHRIIMNCPKDMEVDHIRGVKVIGVCDNRKSNLRVCSREENARNIPMYKDNNTGVKGVSIHSQTNKYVAQITFNGKTYHLGCFDTLEEASKVRKQKEFELFGEFSSLKA